MPALEPMAAPIRRPRGDNGGSGDDEPQPRRPKGDGAVVSGGGPAVGAGGKQQQDNLPGDEFRGALASVLVSGAQAERTESRAWLMRARRRLGHCRRGLLATAVCKKDAHVEWEDGEEAEELEALRRHVAEQKQSIDAVGEQVKKKKGQETEEAQEEIWELAELRNAKLQVLARCELELKEREHRLRVERSAYLRQLHAVEAEDQLSIGSFPPIRKRYQLLRLLGKSKFEDVYRAYDLEKLHPVLVRLHYLDADVKSEVRDQQVAIARAEFDALRNLAGTAIATLFDHFLSTDVCYVTVWEFCRGEPLAEYMLRTGPLPERDARGIILQVVSVVRSAEARGHRLHSRDITPNRLMLCGGEVKVSSVAPQAFEHRSIPRTVSSQMVAESDPQEHEDCATLSTSDAALVWMIALNLHLVLYNKEPDSREPMVQLPEQPKIPRECRKYLTRLLDRDNRPALQEAISDPYVAPSRRQR